MFGFILRTYTLIPMVHPRLFHTGDVSSGQQRQGGPANRPRGQPPGSQQPSGQQGQGSAAAGAAGGEGAPPAEEKTWWQKNWMLVAGVTMAALNLLGNFAKPPHQPAAAAAGGAARAAPRRPAS